MENPIKMFRIINSNGYFNITNSEFLRCGVLQGLLDYQNITNQNISQGDLIVQDETYDLLYKLYIKKVELKEYEYDFLLYIPYELKYYDNYHNFVSFKDKEVIYNSVESDKSEVISPKNIERHWGYQPHDFQQIMLIIKETFEEIILRKGNLTSSPLPEGKGKMNLKETEDFVISGEAALRKCCHYPKHWCDVHYIVIHLKDSYCDRADQIINLLASKFPGKKRTVYNEYIEYDLIRIYKESFSSYEDIINEYDIDSMRICYSYRNEIYHASYRAKYAIQRGFNTLWILDKPINGYEFRNVQALHMGFGLRIPYYSKFIDNFNPDINSYRNRQLNGVEYIYQYLLNNFTSTVQLSVSFIPIKEIINLEDNEVWNPNDWFVTIQSSPKPLIRKSSKIHTNFSFLDAINGSNKAQVNTLTNVPEFSDKIIEPIENGYSIYGHINRPIKFTYIIPSRFNNLTNEYPIFITGGIINCILNIKTDIPYTIHINRDKLLGRSVKYILSEIHQRILRLFNVSRFKESFEQGVITYSCEYLINLDTVPKTKEESLDTEHFDFCRIGYSNTGFITDQIGKTALIKRVHFSSEDIIIPKVIQDLGFRSIVSKEFIKNNLV